MRWVLFAILVYLMTLLQSTAAGVLTIHVSGVGPVRPDLLAIVAVFIALTVDETVDAMLSAWLIGLALDLTSGSGGEISTVVGPMSFTYAIAAGAVHRVREAIFRERMLAQIVTAALFCVVSHGLWVTIQWLVALEGIPWSGYVQMLLQAVLLGVYTAILMPFGAWGLSRISRLFMGTPSKAARRRRG